MEKYYSENKPLLSSIYEESQSHSINNYTNLINNVYNIHKLDKTKLMKRKIMVSLLKAMDKNYNMYLNNINSINFIYQIFGKGINMINHNKINMNKTQSIMNCVRKNKFFTPINTNKFNKYNQTPKHFKLKIKEIKTPLKRSNSCCVKDGKKLNVKKNFVLLPLKNILLKKTIENCHHPPVLKHKYRTSIIYKEKNVIEEEKKKEYQENLKIFSKKYEKEKEDFNNILFDECIEFRKKKFKLESFIKRFTNKHFVEKLYRVKENALQKSQ